MTLGTGVGSRRWNEQSADLRRKDNIALPSKQVTHTPLAEAKSVIRGGIDISNPAVQPALDYASSARV